MQRFSKWAFYWMLAMISVVFAESFSSSTPIIISDIFVLIVYGLHYFILIDFLARYRAITWPTLAIAGLVLGFTTESILTKVIWNPPESQNEAPVRILGLGLFEVGFVVNVWHVWMSTALPVALTLHIFGLAELFNPTQLRRLLRWLPVSLWMLASFGVLDPATLLLMIVVNGLSILALIFLYRLLPPVQSIDGLILARWERWFVLGLLVILYGVGWVALRPEAIPAPAPLILGLGLVLGSIVLLFIMRHRYAGLMSVPPAPSFTYWRWHKYMVYFTIVAMLAGTIAFVAIPVSTALSLVAILFVSLRGNWYLARITFRRQPALEDPEPEPLGIMPQPVFQSDFTS